jgi:radical SAM/Cys-rich protein
VSARAALRVLSEGFERDRFALRVAETTGDLRAATVTTLQVNVGKRCNQACRHCHVDASPIRTEVMPDAVVEDVLDVLARHPQVETLDITGGAPEIHPRFREIVARGRGLGRRVLVRHNLTVHREPGQQDLPGFFAAQGCEVACSLPHYTAEATDRQRGRGVYAASIDALRALNAVGYGRGKGLILDLVANPVGAFLPPRQEDLERDTREHLRSRHGIVFDHLFTITNMPIARFAQWLDRAGIYDQYMDRLERAFNPATVPSLMCRTLLSVGWYGRVYDCDFNQMLDLPLGNARERVHLADLIDGDIEGKPVRVAGHCYGCTAGQGSSCSGALKEAAE